MTRYFLLLTFIFSICLYSSIQGQNLIQNPYNRSHTFLNGEWKYIVDPFENGFYSYRMQEHDEAGYFQDEQRQGPEHRIEYSFDDAGQLEVPGDWNTQSDRLFFYEGMLWYRTTFTYHPKEEHRQFLRFGAVNYHAKVYLDGEKLGEHTGGFTPFEFEITDNLEAGKEHSLVVLTHNKRGKSEVPTVNMDWWNYGGITRDVLILETPETFIEDYSIQLADNDPTTINTAFDLSGNNADELILQIEELNLEQRYTIEENKAAGSITVDEEELTYWSPENPKQYEIRLIAGEDTVTDKIGFRTIETKGDQILLNGEPVFLKGISIHEEAPFGQGRAHHPDHARTLLRWAKELGCNFVRLAHYPHNEHMVRMAEEMGLMVWGEIPVYWTIDWTNDYTLNLAKQQLTELIERDKNRAAVVLWSVANETPRSEERMEFLTSLIDLARAKDPTRLITAATELTYLDNNRLLLDDPLIEHLDVIGANEYFGWYGGDIRDSYKTTWESEYNKPLVISEFGAGALQGLHGDEDEVWTEEHQAMIYRYQTRMLDEIPFLQGMSPWILVDFRSPRRPLPQIQDYWNRKGLISENGQKKEAFFELREYYRTEEKAY